MRHSKEIKEQATARMRAGKTPLFELASEFNISTSTLRAWLRDSDARARAQMSARRVASALSQEKSSSVSQRQRLLILALEQSPATIIVTDAEGTILYANPKMVETTGYQVEEVLGKNPRIMKSGETPVEQYRQLWKTIKEGNVWRGIFHNRRKNGTLYWERASISPVHDAKGRITHFMAVKEDITEFMEADAARRRIEAGFEAVFAALPFAIILVDRQGCILMANEAAQTLFGEPMVRGVSFASLNLLWTDAHSMLIPLTDHPLMRVLAGEKGSDGIETRLGLVPPSGGKRWVRCSARPVPMPETHEMAALLVLTPESDDGS